jgi:hypothetical protein
LGNTWVEVFAELGLRKDAGIDIDRTISIRRTKISGQVEVVICPSPRTEARRWRVYIIMLRKAGVIQQAGERKN